MHVLIIKMSSMGDLIHTLPALTDAGNVFPNIHFDWVAEKPFAEIPHWHPLVEQVIPIHLRQWKKSPIKAFQQKQIQHFLKALRHSHYDAVIDAQGLLKSAAISLLSRTHYRHGFDKNCAREKLAGHFYQKAHHIPFHQHAITRMRELFAQSLGYSVQNTKPEYHINTQLFTHTPIEINNTDLLFLHSTTWVTKHWPEAYWQQLIKKAQKMGNRVLLPWGNEEEHARAKRLAANNSHVVVLPKCSLSEIVAVLLKVKAVVAVDTGLGQLAAALSVPTVSIYGPTNPLLIGTTGDNQVHTKAQFICAPCSQKICTYTKESEVKPACFTTVTPDFIWEQLERVM